jgi:hypothetical protein
VTRADGRGIVALAAIVLAMVLGACSCGASNRPNVPKSTTTGNAVIGSACFALGSRSSTSSGISVVCRKQGTTSRNTWQVG